jgi:hypothetical protein
MLAMMSNKTPFEMFSMMASENGVDLAACLTKPYGEILMPTRDYDSDNKKMRRNMLN